MNPQTFIFIGRSGSGKGTQANILIEALNKKDNLGSLYVSTGKIFRDLGAGSSYTSKLSKEIYEKGELQPEFLAVWAWSDFMVDGLRENEHIVFDGMPRKLDEARVFDSALSFYKRERPTVFYLNVSKDWAIDKLMGRARADDNEEDIKVRMSWFDSEVLPVLDFFKKNSKYNFVEINGEKPVEGVSIDILEKAFS